jgi:hypothetical protein
MLGLHKSEDRVTTFPIAAITDEFSLDLDIALDAMAAIGMTGAELRLIGDRNLIDLSDAEVADVRRRVEQRGMRVRALPPQCSSASFRMLRRSTSGSEQDVFGSATDRRSAAVIERVRDR